MIDLSTEYLGLKLKNPIIVGSCGLTNNTNSLKEIEKKGAAAVVLKSIFEEQIMSEVAKSVSSQDDSFYYPEAEDYISEYTKTHRLESYLDNIREAKKSINIPIIASINCTSSGEWVSFAKEIEKAGADAIELNIFTLPVGLDTDSKEYENNYIKIIQEVKKNVSIPVSVKTSTFFSSLAHTFKKFSWAGADGLVLFNRFYSLDIDIDKKTIIPSHAYSRHDEIGLSLRWIGLLSNNIDCDLCASTGIHDAKGVIKQLLVGAKAVQIVSTVYKNGIDVIRQILEELEKWMEENNYKNLDDFRGEMSFEKTQKPDSFFRVQFMKYFSGIE
ncbi:MAG: dihydroorotate dehydrogenase-like protein [Bacteroidales bacterium]|jgi:dihydroorotate dehydrogenase (fumarate)